MTPEAGWLTRATELRQQGEALYTISLLLEAEGFGVAMPLTIQRALGESPATAVAAAPGPAQNTTTGRPALIVKGEPGWFLAGGLPDRQSPAAGVLCIDPRGVTRLRHRRDVRVPSTDDQP